MLLSRVLVTRRSLQDSSVLQGLAASPSGRSARRRHSLTERRAKAIRLAGHSREGTVIATGTSLVILGVMVGVFDVPSVWSNLVATASARCRPSNETGAGSGPSAARYSCSAR